MHKEIQLKHFATDNNNAQSVRKEVSWVLGCESHLQKPILYLFKEIQHIISVFK